MKSRSFLEQIAHSHQAVKIVHLKDKSIAFWNDNSIGQFTANLDFMHAWSQMRINGANATGDIDKKRGNRLRLTFSFTEISEC